MSNNGTFILEVLTTSKWDCWLHNHIHQLEYWESKRSWAFFARKQMLTPLGRAQRSKNCLRQVGGFRGLYFKYLSLVGIREALSVRRVFDRVRNSKMTFLYGKCQKHDFFTAHREFRRGLLQMFFNYSIDSYLLNSKLSLTQCKILKWLFCMVSVKNMNFLLRIANSEGGLKTCWFRT